MEWVPPGPEVRRRLASRTGSRLRKAVQLGSGLATLLGDAVRGRVLVVCWSWYLPEKLVVALAGLLRGRVILVAHNPGGRGTRSRSTERIEGFEQKFARRLVVHSALLGDRLPADKVRVCLHPPYSALLQAQPEPERSGGPDGSTLLVLGALRPDKGVDQLAEVFDEVAPDVRARLRVHLVGRDPGRGAAAAAALGRLVPVVNDMDELGVSDGRLISALSQADALLAFYPGATQSGSAILAMTIGRPVLAFDTGALPEIIRPEFLAPAGDRSAAARLIESLVNGLLPATSNLMPITPWEDQAMSQWSALVKSAAEEAR